MSLLSLLVCDFFLPASKWRRRNSIWPRVLNTARKISSSLSYTTLRGGGVVERARGANMRTCCHFVVFLSQFLPRLAGRQCVHLQRSPCSRSACVWRSPRCSLINGCQLFSTDSVSSSYVRLRESPLNTSICTNNTIGQIQILTKKPVPVLHVKKTVTQSAEVQWLEYDITKRLWTDVYKKRGYRIVSYSY
jgi:hypothetical protein